MLAWSDHSIKTLKTTLDWLVHRLRPTGVVTIWIDNPGREAQQWLRLTLDQLGFRIVAGSRIEHGVAISARRVEIADLLPRDLSPWGMFMNADRLVKSVMVGPRAAIAA
jgi:hypothetical protein